MLTQSGLLTKDGKPIYTYDAAEALRELEEEKRKKKISSRTFISQSGAQECVQHSCADMDGTGGARGGGKANTYNTLVATPAGFRKMGELKVGDLICTPYEGVQRVKEIFEQGENTVYHFYFDDGTKVACMNNHRFYGRAHADEPFMVWEAKDIMKLYKLGLPFPASLREGRCECFEIPICGEVEINDNITDVDLPISPFILGMISGTGFWHFEKKGINIGHNMMAAKLACAAGYRVRAMRGEKLYYLKGIPDSQIKYLTKSRRQVPAFIPEEYMIATAQARWYYLRGLMYINGRSEKKHPYIELPNKKLIEQTAQMARSLGAWAIVSQVKDNPEKIGFWKVVFNFPDEKMIWLKGDYKIRAKTRGKTPTKMPVSPSQFTLTKKLMRIIKSDKKQPCRCITITGKEHLYLTDAWTINHNTAMLLTKPLTDMRNRYFNGIILRKNKKDFDNIITEIDKWYEPLGKYNKAADDMTFYFNSGAHLSLTHFDMSKQQFDDRIRGQQFAYIGIDEVTQLQFEWFKILMRSNRNTNNIKSRMLFTCNPDPLSWFRTFIDWYVGKEDTIYSDGKMHPERKGLIIPERSGKIRYFYSPNDNVNDIIWGNTPHEVYAQIKDIADDMWDEKLTDNGLTRETFMCKSFRFTKADLMDNKALMQLDPDYYKNLLQAPPEIRERELGGNWDIIKTGNDMIQSFHIERCFRNMQMLGDRIKRASCDVAGTGGDNCVTWMKIGNHVQDVFVCQRDPYTTIPIIKAKLKEWGVLEQNFTYDLQGMGQVFKGAFPNAVPFNNQEACEGDDRKLYDCVKSQAAYLFAQHTQQAEWSIEPTLLERVYTVAGVKMKLYNILQTERKAIRQDMSRQDRGWCLIRKDQMKNKALVGHSPDFIEALLMFEIFNVKQDDVEIPNFLNQHVRHRRIFALA